MDFLIRGGGGHIFICFPNPNAHFRYFSCRKNKLVLKWFLGNFKCFELMLFSEGEGSQNSKFSQFQIFPKLGPKGGGIKFPTFPKSKKVQIILGEGGGGSNKLGTFALFVIFFFLMAPLSALYFSNFKSWRKYVPFINLQLFPFDVAMEENRGARGGSSWPLRELTIFWCITWPNVIGKCSLPIEFWHIVFFTTPISDLP